MIVIIDYKAGNIRSVQNALEKLAVTYTLSDDPSVIQAADKVIFPGVGEASSAMRNLRARHLDKVIRTLKQPILGVCLGLQLLCEFSEENNTECLGVFNLRVKRFPDKDIVPHMGWNNLENSNGNLFEGVDAKDDFYFVHSYYAEIGDNTSAICDYILPFSAALQKNNFYATQFHPEKSARPGSLILQNFLSL
jgi:imidazole glycerol-phosphate synthase subunit HisH